MSDKMEADLSAPSSPSSTPLPLSISPSTLQKISWEWKEKNDTRWTSIPPKNFEDPWILFDEYNMNQNVLMKTLIIDSNGLSRIFFKDMTPPLETLEKIYREAKVKSQLISSEEIESLLKVLKDAKPCPGCDFDGLTLPPKEIQDKTPKRLFDSSGATVALIEYSPYAIRHPDCEILFLGEDKRCLQCEKYTSEIRNFLSETIAKSAETSSGSLSASPIQVRGTKDIPESENHTLTLNALVSLQATMDKYDKLQFDYNLLKRGSEKMWHKLNEKEKEVEDLKKLVESLLRQKYEKFSEDEEEVSDTNPATPSNTSLKRKSSVDGDFTSPSKRIKEDVDEKAEEVEEKDALTTFSNIVSPRQKNSDLSWMNNYQKLVKFKESNGHCNVPHGKKYDKETQKLGYWVKDQRKWKREGKLASHRIQLLDDLGFQWSRLSQSVDS